MAWEAETTELKQAWNALKGMQNTGHGWHTIPLSAQVPVRLLAGISFPEATEALLLSFCPLRIPENQTLPQSKGFEVSRIRNPVSSDEVQIALSCIDSRNLDLFLLMTEDTLSTLAQKPADNQEALFSRFLSRITAWQSFMAYHAHSGLSPQAEQGLFAELLFLEQLLDCGVAPVQAVESWEGPKEGIQDFRIGIGAIEVKSTLAVKGMQIEVFSLEQLDTSTVQPLFLAAFRLALSPTGRTLPEQISHIRQYLEVHPFALNTFSECLLHAGYSESQSARYQRRFQLLDLYCLNVDSVFPGLTRAIIPAEIMQARYTLDLSSRLKDSLELKQCLNLLGVINHGTD